PLLDGFHRLAAKEAVVRRVCDGDVARLAVRADGELEVDPALETAVQSARRVYRRDVRDYFHRGRRNRLRRLARDLTLGQHAARFAHAFGVGTYGLRLVDPHRRAFVVERLDRLRRPREQLARQRLTRALRDLAVAVRRDEDREVVLRAGFD